MPLTGGVEMQRIFHTPEGVRDIYNGECRQKGRLQKKLHKVFQKYGYQDIETPTFEYFEVFSREVGTIPSKDLYKFFDREGNTLVLRPDFTPSVSRACATYFTPETEAVSLCYTGNTFINNSSFRGRLKETTQMGVERIGDESAEADAELLAMTVECLLAAGLKDFQVSVGQVDYFKSLLKEAEIPQETEKRLRELISQKNYFGVDELVQEQKIPKELATAFCELPQMFGSAEILEKAKSLTQNMRALEAVSRLEEIYEILKIYGYEKYITFDFGLLSKYQYYTGIIFQAYTYGTGEPLVKGGRYNELMKHFGKPAASIGFAIVIDTLLLALSSQKISLEKEDNLVVLTYKKEERAQAIREAQKLRAEGKCVTLRLEKETEQP
jgi:ATP phosphoribosyltransferase regulatory subunit